MFLLGPLTGLLLASRPRSLREWWWLLGGALVSVLWLARTGPLPDQVLRAFAALVTGAFLVLMLGKPGPVFSRVLGAVGIAVTALAAWSLVFGVRWSQVQAGVARQGREAYRSLIDLVRDQPGGASEGGASGTVAILEVMSSEVEKAAAFYPAFLIVAAMLGLVLAWRWYHRIAVQPVGPRPLPFGEFRFSDQMVWGVVIGLALMVSPGLPGGARVVGGNLLLVWSTLYIIRGLAVVREFSRQIPPFVLAAAMVAALFMWPFIISGLGFLGLADTWLDFRRRLRTPAPGGT